MQQRLVDGKKKKQIEDVDHAIVNSRNQDIQDLEDEIARVKDIYKDIAQFVDRQYEMIDGIECNIDSASFATKQGVAELRAAESFQRRSWFRLPSFSFGSSAASSSSSDAIDQEETKSKKSGWGWLWGSNDNKEKEKEQEQEKEKEKEKEEKGKGKEKERETGKDAIEINEISVAPKSSTPTPTSTSSANHMRELIMKQKASGNWNLADISGLLGSLTSEKIRDALASLLEDKVTSEIEAIWATAVVIAYLKVPSSFGLK